MNDDILAVERADEEVFLAVREYWRKFMDLTRAFFGA